MPSFESYQNLDIDVVCRKKFLMHLLRFVDPVPSRSKIDLAEERVQWLSEHLVGQKWDLFQFANDKRLHCLSSECWGPTYAAYAPQKDFNQPNLALANFLICYEKDFFDAEHTEICLQRVSPREGESTAILKKLLRSICPRRLCLVQLQESYLWLRRSRSVLQKK